MNKKLAIFNLKMNAPILADWEKVGKSKSEIVVCPPFVYIERLKNLKIKTLKLGAQDIFWENQGAYTGEISSEMLKNLGVEYVIVGHSERRKYLDEMDGMINKKVLAGLRAGLKVILCVGENLIIHKRGIRAVKDFIKRQLQKDLKSSKFLILNSKLRNHLMIAYEPVWAIGAGKACKPENALEIIKFIKEKLDTKYKIQNTKVIYGGSVDGKNVADFVKYRDVDGVLVGSASLKLKEVVEIIKKVS